MSGDAVDERDYQWLLGRSGNAYELLSLESPSCSLAQIKKAYRRKALMLHPDKNKADDAEEQFREISISYKVLSSSVTRNRYDEHLNEQTLRKDAISTEKDKLKRDLLNSEALHRQKVSKKWQRDQKLASLHAEFEQLKRQGSSESLQPKTGAVPVKVWFKWKNRPELGDTFNEDLLRRLVEVFGPIDTVKFSSSNKPHDKYHYASVSYKSPVSSSLAVTYDYSHTGSLWDELGLRKLASLLRSAKLIGEPDENNDLAFDDYVALSNIKLQSVLA